MAVDGRDPEASATELGVRLREVRVLRGTSLSAVAREAAISTAYLQKLEAGGVKHPSPRVLHRLAEALGLDYAALMALAGYVVPGPKERSSRGRRNRLTHSLGSEELTEDEARELARYLEWYRHRQRTGAP